MSRSVARMQLKNALNTVMVLCAGSSLLCAQTIRGRVVNDSTFLAVAGAEVVLLDSIGNRVADQITEADGGFIFAIASGQFAFTINRIGFTPTATSTFTVPAEVAAYEVTILVSSKPVAVLLPEVVVEGDVVPPVRLRGFHQRRVEGFGSFVTRGQIEEWTPCVTTDVLRRMRGIRVRPNGAYGRGRPPDTRRYIVESVRIGGLTSCTMLYFLDGIYVGNAGNTDVDMLLAVSSIAGIEAYSGPSQTPAVFNRTGSQCGVIAFWTR